MSRHLGRMTTGTYGTMAWIVCHLYFAKGTVATRSLPVLGPMSRCCHQRQVLLLTMRAET